MGITEGKIVGEYVIDKGSTVTVSNERTFTVEPDDETALLLAIAEADRDDLGDGDDVIKKIS